MQAVYKWGKISGFSQHNMATIPLLSYLFSNCRVESRPWLEFIYCKQFIFYAYYFFYGEVLPANSSNLVESPVKTYPEKSSKIYLQKMDSCNHFCILNIFSDCSLPFSVGVRTSNENRGGSLNLPNIPPAKIFGQKWDQEVETIQARGVCLNYEQKPCE